MREEKSSGRRLEKEFGKAPGKCSEEKIADLPLKFALTEKEVVVTKCVITEK